MGTGRHLPVNPENLVHQLADIARQHPDHLFLALPSQIVNDVGHVATVSDRFMGPPFERRTLLLFDIFRFLRPVERSDLEFQFSAGF